MATPPVIVNGDKSLILIDTKALISSQTAVVLLSSILNPGRTVTIRDSLGFLSSPQTILVSTMRNVRFADGASSVLITQPFSYVTVTSRDPTSWNLTNTFGFPQYETVANVLSLSTNYVTTCNIYARGIMSTNVVTTASLHATSTSAVYGPLYASTLVVAAPTPGYQPYFTDPGFNAYIQGNLKTYASIEVQGSAQYTNTISTGGNLSITGNISSLGAFGARGDIMTLGNIYAQYGGAFFRTLDVQSTATFAGPVILSNVVNIGTNLTVGNILSTPLVATSTLRVQGEIQLQTRTIQNRTNDILFSAPITTPSMSTTNFQASNAVTTSNLAIFRSLEGPLASSFVLSSAQIRNPAGSLLISSVSGNTATFSRSIVTSNVNTSTLRASSIILSGSITAPASGILSIGAATISSLSTGVMATGILLTNAATTSSLYTSSLQVYNTLIANNLTTFTASNASIDNRGGSIVTNNISLQNMLAASTITTTSGLFQANSSTLRFVASNVVMNNTNISTLFTSSITTSSLTATRIQIGSQTNAFSNGPTFSADTVLFTSTNVVITGGPGDYLTPFTVSNVKPPGLGPTDPYPIEVSFRLNFNGPYLPGYFAMVPGLTLFPNGQPTSLLTLRSLDDSNVITSLFGIFGSNQTYSSDPSSGIPIPTGPLPSSFFHLTGTMIGNSAFSFQFQSRSNSFFSAIDSNAFIRMDNGVLQWPYSLNGTTIQNSLNDMSVRTLYYYGGLSFASDPALKEAVTAANLDRCLEIVQDIPLHRYKFKDFYLSSFGVQDAHRLGVLADELETIFPKSITYTQLDGVPAVHQSTIRMIDTQQLDMAHIGATKAIAQRVSTLSSRVGELQAEIRTLKNLLNS